MIEFTISDLFVYPLKVTSGGPGFSTTHADLEPHGVTKEEVAAALAREDGVRIWWCAFKETADIELTCRRGIPEHHKNCGPHLLIPLGETPQ